MKVRAEATPLPDVLIVIPEVFQDARGFFMEVFRTDKAAAYADLGLPSAFVQVNQSRSVKDVVRGLHFQWEPPMGKLMRACAMACTAKSPATRGAAAATAATT